jgi:hypothetical protein
MYATCWPAKPRCIFASQVIIIYREKTAEEKTLSYNLTSNNEVAKVSHTILDSNVGLEVVSIVLECRGP